jgi:predicted  nucleic acid-binding Zn-ribbon protein
MEKPICHHCKMELTQNFLQDAINDLKHDWKKAHHRIQRYCEHCGKIIEFEVTSGMYYLITSNGTNNIGAK